MAEPAAPSHVGPSGSSNPPAADDTPTRQHQKRKHLSEEVVRDSAESEDEGNETPVLKRFEAPSQNPRNVKTRGAPPSPFSQQKTKW